MVEINEIEKQILKQEYPLLSLTDDLDIERYFELRKKGSLNEALNLYNRKLKKKYPDEKKRIELMSCYRQRSPHFQELLTENLKQLASQTIFRIKQIIEIITKKIATLDLNDVYNVVQQCELIVSAISKDRFAAISFTEKYYRNANILDYKKNEMKKSAEIIRMYVTDTLSSVREFKEEQANETRRRNRLKNEYKPAKVFDFSKIVFTKEQESAIIIPKNILRVEDKVIAYCLKYWDSYKNSAFENAVLLYSRKFKTNHFNIFQVVKIGRMRGWRDDEILQAVLSNVVSGYYYSISGDLYLQRQWGRAKASLQLKEKNNQLALPQPKNNENDVRKKTKPKKKTKQKIKKQIKQKVKQKQEVQQKIKKETKKNIKIEVITPKNIRMDNIQNNMSISQIIMNLTNSKYKIHKGLFFDSIRKSIRKELAKQNIDKVSVFNDEKNNAENLIYSFFEDNYDNPFQNWKKSKQFTEVSKIGFSIQQVDSIIEDWAKNARE